MITTYPDEPHPNNEFEWKRFWVSKMFKPKEPLYEQDLNWVHHCWQTTLANWRDKKEAK